MRIEKSPLPRKLLIFTVSARFFTNCTFTIPWSVLETFILERKAWAFAKWRKSIIVQPSDAFLKTPYRSLQNSVYSCFFKVFCEICSEGCILRYLSFVLPPTIPCGFQECVLSPKSGCRVSHAQTTCRQKRLGPQQELIHCLPRLLWAREEQPMWPKGWKRVPWRKGSRDWGDFAYRREWVEHSPLVRWDCLCEGNAQVNK